MLRQSVRDMSKGNIWHTAAPADGEDSWGSRATQLQWSLLQPDSEAKIPSLGSQLSNSRWLFLALLSYAVSIHKEPRFTSPSKSKQIFVLDERRQKEKWTKGESPGVITVWGPFCCNHWQQNGCCLYRVLGNREVQYRENKECAAKLHFCSFYLPTPFSSKT